jgi:hypothetical protein
MEPDCVSLPGRQCPEPPPHCFVQARYSRIAIKLHNSNDTRCVLFQTHFVPASGHCFATHFTRARDHSPHCSSATSSASPMHWPKSQLLALRPRLDPLSHDVCTRRADVAVLDAIGTKAVSTASCPAADNSLCSISRCCEAWASLPHRERPSLVYSDHESRQPAVHRALEACNRGPTRIDRRQHRQEIATTVGAYPCSVNRTN